MPAPVLEEGPQLIEVQRRDSQRIEQSLYNGAGVLIHETFFPDRSELPSSLVRYYFAPGTSEGMHLHAAHVAGSCTPDDADELYVVISGELTLTIEGESVSLAAGDAAYAPTGTLHGVANDSEVPAELIIMWGPPARSGRTSD